MNSAKKTDITRALFLPLIFLLSTVFASPLRANTSHEPSLLPLSNSTASATTNATTSSTATTASSDTQNSAQPMADVHVIMDTKVKDIDGSHLTLEFGKLPLNGIRDHLNSKIAFSDKRATPDLIPSTSDKVALTIFVPSSLSQSDKDLFVAEVEKQLAFEQKTLKVVTVEIGQYRNSIETEAKQLLTQFDKSSEEHQVALKIIEAETKKLDLLEKWSLDMKKFINNMKDVKHWPKEQQYMFFGSLIGVGKSISSVAFWTTTTGFNAYGIAQSVMSVALDFIFSRWGHRIQSWKSSHEIPAFGGIKVLDFIRNLYNKNTLIKTFIIDNLIGVSAGAYFRWLSWMADTSGKISSPLSMDYLTNVLGGMTLGGLLGSAGSQGVVTLRKKGYITVGVEYSLYQVFGLGMQIGGFLNGSGMSELFWLYLKTEAISKGALFAASRLLPNKSRRVIIMHPDLDEKQISEIKYGLGMYDVKPLREIMACSKLYAH